MIEARDLTRIFGERAVVSGLTFQVGRGEIVGLLGTNGAGKTTTMRILATLLRPTRGGARVAGHDVVTEAQAVRRALAFAPERPPLYDDMTVGDYLEFVAALREVPARERRKRRLEVGDRTGLAHLMGRLVGHLSRGWRQRLGLAQALMGRPRVLVLDEPTAGLDPNQVQEVRALVHSLSGEVTVVLSTHLLMEVEALCHRVLIIHEGRLVAEERLRGRSGSGRLRIQVARDEPAVAPALLRLPGVRSVLRDDSAAGCYLLECEAGADRREAMSEMAVERGWGVLELTDVGSSLQELFARVTSGRDPA